MNTAKAAAEKIRQNFENASIPMFEGCSRLPNKNVVISLIKDLQKLLFPGYFDDLSSAQDAPDLIYKKLHCQVVLSVAYRGDEDVLTRADEICKSFFEALPKIHLMLLKDIDAGFEGDPAAKTREEIVFCYPGFLAIFVYRIAHILYTLDVPFLPRIMTEYAHSRTGIDINSGAQIGEHFFIDHGTGVVIGETAVIGSHVKIYQGVTLGALSLKSGQKLRGKKRHPTVEDNVTIYSGASILGGETVIGRGSTIGGNAFITESVAENSKIIPTRK